MASFRKNLRLINQVICFLPNYHENIPLDTVFGACEKHGLVPLQEDGTRWGGFLCGSEGEMLLPLGDKNEFSHWQGVKVFTQTRHALRFAWHKMPSGRYEITSYVS